MVQLVAVAVIMVKVVREYSLGDLVLFPRLWVYLWLPLTNIQYSNEEGEGRWYNLDADRVVENGEVKGTANPTGDSLLLDCRFELPWGKKAKERARKKALDPVLPNGPCGSGEPGQAYAGVGGSHDAPPSSLSPPSSSTARPSLSTVKLLNTVTFETIESATDYDDDECVDSSKPSERPDLLTTAASETVDSGIGNDELGAETSISRFLSRSDEAKVEQSDAVSGTDEGGSSPFRFSFQIPLSQKDRELSSPAASDSKTFTWDPETSVSSYANAQSSSPKVTLVTTKFASLSVCSPDREQLPPCKTFPETSSPSAVPSSGIFNIKLLKENLLRESEGLDPLQPSPNLEDSSSTSSYLTLSGSSGFFSKSNATDEVPSSKTSPTAETEYPTEVNGEVPSSTFNFLRSPARTEPEAPPAEEAPSTDSFRPTRFSFLTRDYLPPLDSSTEEEQAPGWSSSSSEQPISSPVSGFTFSFSRTTEASATTLTSATATPVLATTTSPPQEKSRFFTFLNLRHSPGSESPPSVASGESEQVSTPGSVPKLNYHETPKVCDDEDGETLKDEKTNKLLSEKIKIGSSESKQSEEEKKDLEETEAQELQRKLEILNHIMDQETRGAPGNTRNPQLNLMSGMSEDSDYTSDINYPVGQHPNSSVSQFLGVATQMSTPQRSLETSRENSYERDDGVQYGGEPGYGEGYDRGMADDYYSYTLEHNKKNEGHKPSVADEDLFYNSRPNNRKDYRYEPEPLDEDISPVSYYSKHGLFTSDQNEETQPTKPTSNNARGKLTRAKQHTDEDGTTRRPSLERQTTMYDEEGGGQRTEGTSRENSAPAVSEGEYGYDKKTRKEDQVDQGYQNEEEGWYDKERTDGYYGDYNKECYKDEGYQNDKSDDGYAGEQYDQYGYGYDQYSGYDEYYGYDKTGENYDYAQYGYYGEDGTWIYYQNYDGYYGYYDEAGVFHTYNENYNYAYRSNEHLDSMAELQGDIGKAYDSSKVITAPSSLASTFTITTSAITTTKALNSVLPTTTSSSTTAKSVGNHVAPTQTTQQKADGLFNKLLPQLPISLPSTLTTTTVAATTTATTTTVTTTQSNRTPMQPAVSQASVLSQQRAAQQKIAQQKQQQQQQQAKPAAGGFGIFGGMNKKGGLFNAMSGITSKVSDTLNTAVKEVSATAAAAAQQANVAAQQTTKAATAKAAAAAKSAGVVPPQQPPFGQKPPTTQAGKQASSMGRTLTKQESVRSDKMPVDEAERQSLATLPETTDPNYQAELDQTSLWQQESYETALTDKTQQRQDSFETAPEDSLYDEDIQGQDEYYDEDYDSHWSRRGYPGHDPYYDDDYYDDDRRSQIYEDYPDSFDNDDVSSIVGTERGLPRYPSQGDRFLDGDTQYSTEYESGTESREAVNDRIEPYPGDLSKENEEKPKESKIIDFDMKTRAEHVKAESDTAKVSPEGGSTRETSAAKDSKKMLFEAKMMQMSNDKSTVAPSEKVQAVGEKLQSHYDGKVVEKELPVQSAEQTQTVAEAHTPSKSLAEADVKVMSQNEDDVASGEPIKTQNHTEKSKDKLFNFEAKLRQVQLGPSAQPSQVQSGPTATTLSQPAEQVSRQSSFEDKMRQMKGILKLPTLPTSLPTSLPIKLPDLTRGSVPKPQASAAASATRPAAAPEQAKEAEHPPQQKVTQPDKSSSEPAADQAKKDTFEEKMKALQKPSSEAQVQLEQQQQAQQPQQQPQQPQMKESEKSVEEQKLVAEHGSHPPTTGDQPTEVPASQEGQVEVPQQPTEEKATVVDEKVAGVPSTTGPAAPDTKAPPLQQQQQQQQAKEDAVQGDTQITSPGTVDAAATTPAGEAAREVKLSPLPSTDERHVSFEEDGGVPGEEGPPKKKMTARERWYWAFDKIVAKLNVSTRGHAQT
ncbi:uncharacterized protein LOC135109485 [Scylla paramamosain]|uniref:uncharacterized protein LOC135109485 n=1 Tax=Scylla paramamosain TaxID=85552 RepID=UPI003082F543